MIDTFDLNQVNGAVNSIPPHVDASLPDGVWDCEDYALAKARKLAYMGARPSDLKFKIYDTPWGRHMVLVYKEKYVLDNLTDGVYTVGALRKRGYEEPAK